jgi:hypothetical protein
VLSRPANERGHDWRWQSYDIPLGFTATTFSLRNSFDSDLCPPCKMVWALITETPRLGHAATSVSCQSQNRRTDPPHELCDGGDLECVFVRSEVRPLWANSPVYWLPLIRDLWVSECTIAFHALSIVIHTE